MRRITLIGPWHLWMNPRLVRDADALAEAGYDVRVLGARYLPELVRFDEELKRGRKWRYEYVDFLNHRWGPIHWQRVRVRRRVCGFIADRLGWNYTDRRAYGYAGPELTKLAMAEKTDLFIAHQHSTLPAAARAAARWNCPYGFDAEDLLAESPDEPRRLVRRLEQRYLSGCAYVSTMSRAAAQRLQEIQDLRNQPIVLHNTPRLEERAELVEPVRRPIPEVPSIYWFGQTLGPGSCAERVIRALPLLVRPARLVLRGNPCPSYLGRLRQLAENLAVAHRLEIAPVASPRDMVRLAGQHDILLGSQRGSDRFHVMAIGNKVFTGMMAGLALALTDTVAHRILLQDAPGSGFLFPDGDSRAFAAQLNPLLSNPLLLRQCQQKSWLFAEQRFNWEKESLSLLHTVSQIVESC